MAAPTFPTPNNPQPEPNSEPRSPLGTPMSQLNLLKGSRSNGGTPKPIPGKPGNNQPDLSASGIDAPSTPGANENSGDAAESSANAEKGQAPSADQKFSIRAIEDTVNSFYPGLLPATKCGLAVVASMAFKERTKPIAVMFESPSGFGKSAVVQMFFPISGSDKTSTADLYVYRCDKFSPKSFVSHAANVSVAQLANVDLLPRLKNKTLVTKEMAPIFRGREKELEENFSTIIAVLDGKGLMTDSGTKGRRGYDENILFNWLGATTPVPPQTHRLMSQLGTRLLFYEIPSELPTEEALFVYAERDEAAHAESACQSVVNQFIFDFFRAHPTGSVDPASIVIPPDRGREIVRFALLVAHGRREIRHERLDKGGWTPVSAAQPEGPHKVLNYFKDLARAHALIHGRSEVTAEDMGLVSTIAISSIPHHLRPIVRKLQRADSVTSGECQRLCSVSRPTARKYLQELALTGIGTLEDAEEEPITLTLTLSPGFSWLKLP